MMALRRRLPSPVLFAALMNPADEGCRWFARILGCEVVDADNSFTHIALTLNAFATGGVKPADCPLSLLSDVEWTALKLAMCGMGAEEMSRLHGVTSSAVRQRIRHALDKLGMAGQLRIVPSTLLTSVTHNPARHLTLMELSAAGLNNAGFPDMPEQSVPDMSQDRVRHPGLVSGFY
jgi:DNA-binding CsgD family transcriptional regulator